MIKVIPLDSIGHVNHGWLNAKHHFSFGSYHNPERMGFGTLRVINDDTIEGGTGFDTHPHRNMEIITYVRTGAISHEDSQGNKGKTNAGDVQVMSAGSGIYHSEYNDESVDTTLYQIWIEPNQTNVSPRWDAKAFPKTKNMNALSLLVSGNKEDDALFIYQDACIYGGNIEKGTEINHPIKHQAYILISKGSISIDDHIINMGDGAEITNLDTINIKALDDTEILVIDAP